MFRIIAAQPCPVGLPQAHAPQLRLSVSPVYQASAEVPAGQEWVPSNSAHFAATLTGTQTCPLAQPPPTIAVAQKRLEAPQATGPGVPAPVGVHDPDSVGVKVPTWTPRMLPPTAVTQLGVVQVVVAELNVVTIDPGLLVVAQSV